jgi:putative hemolysin
MPLAARLENYFDAEARRARSKHRLRLRFAETLEDLRAAQRLRHRVFVEEMGARLPLAEPGIESDRFDHYCQHLLVWDEETDQAVGCYRILTDSQAMRAGGYYAQTEFDLTRVLAVPGRLIEVGRTCVRPGFRNGAVLDLLLSGLARYMLTHRYDYLMGCASIPLGKKVAPALSALPPSMAVADGVERVGAIWHALSAHLSAPEWRVFPKTPFAALPEATLGKSAELPPLIKGYLRLGAQVCGEPAWDPAFNVADLFLLLSPDRINARYAQHFIRHV